jgi:hypothetical protein
MALFDEEIVRTDNQKIEDRMLLKAACEGLKYGAAMSSIVTVFSQNSFNIQPVCFAYIQVENEYALRV